MTREKGLVFWFLKFVTIAALALPGTLRAQGNFVYTDDDIFGPNTVSGFSVAANGTLTLLQGSPFSTNGIGSGGGWTFASRVAVSTVRNFLFAANTDSNDISTFAINVETGALTLIGSPYSTGGSAGPAYGAGEALAVTSDGQFLLAANAGSNNITVFTIASNGALGAIAGSPFATRGLPAKIKLTPDGKFLAVTEPFAEQIETFAIAPNGSLTSLGAFPDRGGTFIAAEDIHCSGRFLYADEANETGTSGTIVDGYFIRGDAVLTPIPGSPFEPGVGTESAAMLLGYGRGQVSLYVVDHESSTIAAFTVAGYDGLTLMHGSPFPLNSPGAAPSDLATSQDGGLLYVANFNAGVVSVFSVSQLGGLTEVAGSPFATGQGQGMNSLVAFPPRKLSLLESLLDGCSVVQ